MFGPYRLMRLLGSGGFGEVYEAEDTAMHRVVALKLLSATYSRDPVFRERLFREARTAGRLREPHVLPIHSCGEIDGQVYIDMRLVRGVDLDTVLQREGPLEPARAVAIVLQVAGALDAAHAETVIHRDVKPANVLLSGDDFASLVDFGLANAAGDARLTKTGKAVGTFDYVAPERLNNTPVDHRCDVYALACVLYELLTGKTPYADSGDLSALMTAQLSAPIPRASHQRAGIPAEFDEVIARGMAKNPDARFFSAGEFAAAAQRVLQPAATTRPWSPEPPAAQPLSSALPPPAPWQRQPIQQRRRGKPRRRLIAAAAVGVVTALAIAAVIAWIAPWRGDGPHTTASRPRPSTATPTTLPFPPLAEPRGVTVDKGGTVYVAELGRNAPQGRILKLTPSENSPRELPFGELYASGVATDKFGNVYVADINARGVWMLAPGGHGPAMLPFGHLQDPMDVAVDDEGTVYVVDMGLKQLVRLRSGASGPKQLMPTTPLENPLGVAVDRQRNVYVVANDARNVLKLSPEATTPTELPFAGLDRAYMVAVDKNGSVYVTDPGKHRVLRLAAGANSSTELPFPGLHYPFGVATDEDDNVYVVDCERADHCVNGRVLMLGSPS
ncbi:protein kinase [Mycobacterium vicinigordonae]|uniref:non-specific serine/threonine protein kinase n=2 Tax=Mycobacterium vicinigordonae TaxID=1719132 RepID=A0A7D6E6A0_9MYCO|nr:protein kinase [Mycobacterium vicinigordonae]